MQLSLKNPVSNFISANDEMLAFLSNLGQKWRIGGGIEEFMERNFTFVGSKPVLRTLKEYKTAVTKLKIGSTELKRIFSYYL